MGTRENIDPELELRLDVDARLIKVSDRTVQILTRRSGIVVPSLEGFAD